MPQRKRGTMLTRDEIKLILELIAEKYGPGYSDIPSVGQLQAKLSIMLQAAETCQKTVMKMS